MRAALPLLLSWLAFSSLIAAALTMGDKYAAQRHKRRVSEQTLFLWAFLGGSIIMLLTMRLVHHKTLHKRFMWGLPVIALIQLGALAALFYFFG